MAFYKDLYIQELERELAELEDQGVPSDKAYELAGFRAYDRLRERLQYRSQTAERKKLQ